MMSRLSRETWKDIGLPVLTLLLTPVFSAFVVSFQIAKSQDTWLEQRRLDRESVLEESRLRYLERIATQIGKLSAIDQELKTAVFYGAFDLALDIQTPERSRNRTTPYAFQGLNPRIQERNVLVAELNGSLSAAAALFDPPVDSLVNAMLHAYLTRDSKQVDIKDLFTEIYVARAMKRPIPDVLDSMANAVLMTSENRTFFRERDVLLNTMFDQIRRGRE